MPEPADWTWEFATAATAAELGTHPELLLKTATPVKANPVRKVFRTKEFYLKFDCRPGNRLAREWRSAALLAARRIPMVEHLAWGRSSQGELLITRALPDAEQAGTYFFRQCLRNGVPAEVFAEALAEFARQIIGSGLFHPDFHCGNVLYLPERNQFALVDVYGVRRATMFDHFRYYRMERILMELREAFDRAHLLLLLAIEGVSAPESFYRKALHREARYLFHEWSKRKRQILAGYPKFTRAEESLLRVVDPTGEVCDVSTAEPVAGDSGELERLLLAHFFLQLACIPHRRVVLLDRAENLLYREARPAGSSAPVPVGDWPERLAAYGLEFRPEEWGFDRFGRPELQNFQQVTALV